MNKLVGESRSVVDAVAGTTVDPVDSLVELDGEIWRFVDTAGLRRRVNQARGMEFYASLRTQSALETAEVAIVLVDSADPLTEQDQRVISMVVDSGRALVIAMNKADLVDADRREEIDKETLRDLNRVTWAELINISARTGRGVHRLAPALRTALESWDKRIPTGRLNTWLRELIAATPPPVRGGKQPRVLFATQASNRPPTFVLFTTGFLEAGYRRFVERRLREDFGFTGSPVRVNVRVQGEALVAELTQRHPRIPRDVRGRWAAAAHHPAPTRPSSRPCSRCALSDPALTAWPGRGPGPRAP